MAVLKTLKIATRQSPLALWQANFVKDQLEKFHPTLSVELVPMVTKGDVILDSPLAKIGGKGLFVKELENALLEKRADIAVHSMKDVPMEFPEGLGLSVICKREDPRDAFVSNTYRSLDELPQGAIVGTSSLRRQCQLKQLRPDLDIRSLRGNVGTRLSKLDNGEYDAIILASAGLIRLGLAERIASFIEVEQSLPAAGQGAVRRFHGVFGGDGTHPNAEGFRFLPVCRPGGDEFFFHRLLLRLLHKDTYKPAADTRAFVPAGAGRRSDRQ